MNKKSIVFLSCTLLMSACVSFGSAFKMPKKYEGLNKIPTREEARKKLETLYDKLEKVAEKKNAINEKIEALESESSILMALPEDLRKKHEEKRDASKQRLEDMKKKLVEDENKIKQEIEEKKKELQTLIDRLSGLELKEVESAGKRESRERKKDVVLLESCLIKAQRSQRTEECDAIFKKYGFLDRVENLTKEKERIEAEQRKVAEEGDFPDLFEAIFRGE